VCEREREVESERKKVRTRDVCVFERVVFIYLFVCQYLTHTHTGIRVGKMDCTEEDNKAVCAKYGVSGYPTLKLSLNKDKDPMDYDGMCVCVSEYVEKCAPV
jgi:hypothetical protein